MEGWASKSYLRHMSISSQFLGLFMTSMAKVLQFVVQSEKKEDLDKIVTTRSEGP